MNTDIRSRSAYSARKLTYTALYLAIALALPFLTGQIPEIGSMLCPMHIPVLLCGFVCGWSWGLVIGFIAPPLRSLLFGMPQMYPEAIAMAFELAAYGAISGIMYCILPKKKGYVYVSLIIAMVVGRIVWGGVRFALMGLGGSTFSPTIFLAGAVTSAIPGIILHIVLIPVFIFTLQKIGLTLND